MFGMKISFTFLFFLCFIYSSSQDKLELFFDFDQAVINEKSALDFGAWLKISKEVTIVKIEGYCDRVDSDNYNKKLAFQRINYVLEQLRVNAIPTDDKIELNAIGENFRQSITPSENRKVIVYYTNPKANQKEITIPSQVPIAINRQNQEMILQPLNSNLIQQLENAKVGDLIQLQNLNFYFNSEKLMTESIPVLSSLLNALRVNPQLKINIHGHICCNTDPNDVKLSYRRSKFIFDYLIRNGIATSRLGHKGFGSSKSLYPVPERNEAERVANRRVEIFVVQK
jgi:outer membrane protein OmpA-like peptidoglycan-associated protein